MKRSTAKALSVICAVVAIVACCLFISSENQLAMAVILAIYLPIAILLNYFQRCRHCGRWPRKHDFWAEYCPRCGKPLDD